MASKGNEEASAEPFAHAGVQGRDRTIERLGDRGLVLSRPSRRCTVRRTWSKVNAVNGHLTVPWADSSPRKKQTAPSTRYAPKTTDPDLSQRNSPVSPGNGIRTETAS
ncbi:hypothetical protein [Streptomyces bugieae]|uniref:Uncharacterized protein n=1 Tax=Streptomyces bugieae TaxID=3098223 RepID=A0ABU7NZH3_9ACTN|nr:hypothetical protein [Streptomyces sp. DSM 41528]